MARPSKYKPQYCDDLIEHMSHGGTLRGFSGTIPVCIKTIYTWLDTHKEFKEAYGIAQSKGFLWWENLLLSKIVTHKDDTQLNTTAWIFAMKNMFGWRDRHEIESKPESLTPEKLAVLAEYAKLRMAK